MRVTTGDNMPTTGRSYTNLEIVAARNEWQGLRNDLSSAEQRIRRIIDNQLWLPLGYTDFKTAWNTELADCDLGIRALRHVVYQMLDEGQSDQEIAAEVDGVGIPTVEALRSDKAAGIRAGEATTRVRSHQRVIRPHTLHLYLGAEVMDELHHDADQLGKNVMVEALGAVERLRHELRRQVEQLTNV